MRFSLIDRVIEVEPGVRITARKSLSMAEEYLADHFPTAPVMPGVLMLQALTEACSWLVRAGEDFAHSMVVLKEARNVKYASFVEPGTSLEITAELVSQDERLSKFKAQGAVDGGGAVAARLVLERFNLSEQNPGREAADAFLRARLRETFSLLYHPKPTAA